LRDNLLKMFTNSDNNGFFMPQNVNQNMGGNNFQN